MICVGCFMCEFDQIIIIMFPINMVFVASLLENAILALSRGRAVVPYF